MRNVAVTVKGNLMTIVVDLSAKAKLSKSGKTDLVATTNGFAESPAKGVSVALNVCRKRAA